MRLSLMKAAHASVGDAPCRKSGTMGRKRILQTLSLHCTAILALGRSLFAHVTEALTPIPKAGFVSEQADDRNKIIVSLSRGIER
jgi:hypothetical protein